mmetsp:Transcript_51688/g.105215  ORF Transcript_51688/g.105215 Transcript_51688/m.105215 type:complete len:80 (+) Transcript_51688:716-955(+)
MLQQHSALRALRLGAWWQLVTSQSDRVCLHAGVDVRPQPQLLHDKRMMPGEESIRIAMTEGSDPGSPQHSTDPAMTGVG